MPDPQVPANAVQEAQAILQNPAPDEAQAPAAQAQVPAGKLMKFLWRFVKLYFLCPLSRVSSWFSSVFVCFGSTLLFCFVRPAFTFTTFHGGFAGHAFCNLFVCGLPCFERFALFWWALRAIF